MGDKKQICVEMLGGFTMAVEGKRIGLGTNNKANFLKLIQVILLHRGSGISRREVIDAVFGYKHLLDENNSLNNLLHQARSQLKQSGFPGRKFIEGKKGIYSLEKLPDYEIVVDIDVFTELCTGAAEAANPDEKAELYAEAFALYRGEMLPEFATDYWVILESVRLKHLYDDAIEFLGTYYREREEYEKLYQLYSHANQLYPDDGWMIRVIEVLILKKEFKAAYELYTEAVRYYQEELGVPLPESLNHCYELICDDVRVISDDIQKIQQTILQKDELLKSNAERNGIGAYFCNFSSFIDIYHVLQRNMDRRGNSIFMMLCTLVDYEGKAIRSQEKLNKRADLLQDALFRGLRKGDVFTKYSQSQFLLLLIGTKKEDCTTIYQRISHMLKENACSRAEFQYRIVSLAEIPAFLKENTL